MAAKPGAGALVALASGVLALAAFVTTTSEGALWSWSDTVLSNPVAKDTPRCKTAEECARQESANRDAHQTVLKPPAWLVFTSELALISLGIVCVVIIVRRFRIRRRLRFDPGKLAPRRAPPEPEQEETDVQALADEIGTQLAVLEAGEPRNAIVAAWIALETAAERAGVPRNPSETPAEFTRRAMAKYHLDEDALLRLADLYREARFSRHRLTPTHLDHARECLRVLVDDLRRGLVRQRGAG